MSERFTIMQGDMLARLRELPDNSVDAIVTDPPYGLGQEPDALAMLRDWITTGHHEVKARGGFMGKAWDSFVPQPAQWRECLRVLKPGGHLLAFAGTRTQDLVTLGLRIAGFEIRDSIAWLYGSGFPKSLDVSKAIDKAAGAERARQWAGWGTALKPAIEPITVARKPLTGTVAENVREHGTGALNIDGCRVACGDRPMIVNKPEGGNFSGEFREGSSYGGETTLGRWPANVVHDGSDEVLALFPDAKGAVSNGKKSGTGYGAGYGVMQQEAGYADSGSAARFFYCAKASRRDRNEGCESMPKRPLNWSSGTQNPGSFQSEGADKSANNHHPTVKPTDLMRWLVRLVTPPGGLVLDPFMGSGSTGKACMLEGVRFVGIEREAEYAPIAQARIEHAAKVADRLTRSAPARSMRNVEATPPAPAPAAPAADATPAAPQLDLSA